MAASRLPPRFSETLLRLARVMAALEHASPLKPVHWEVLRYLARCNRFSNTPTALAQFLRSTKGTVSQSLQAIARRGLIERRADARSARLVRLSLTEAGHAMLRTDPLAALDDLLPEDRAQREALVPGLRSTLRKLHAKHRLKPFGTCWSCRYFRSSATGGAFCGFFLEPLTDDDINRICHEHAEAA